MRKTDNGGEAIEYDKNAIGVSESRDDKTLVGHLRAGISCLLTYFLKAAPENKLGVIIAGKRNGKLNLLSLQSKLLLHRTKHLQIFYQRNYIRRKKASKF